MDQPDNQDFNINFLTGINWLLASDYNEAIHFFLVAIVETDPSDEHYSVYQSYAGLSSVLMHELGGLHHCYHSSDLSPVIEPEVQLNLACAEFISCNRKRAIQAMDKIDDSDLSSKSSEEILSFFDMVGKREKGAKGLLKRDNFIHKFIGRIFRKRKNIDIEEFIRETAKKRYKTAMLKLKKVDHLKAHI